MKILIADDESLVRQSIRLFWLELGIQPEDITEVSNGMSLIEALKNHYFDLALVDIQMPYRNGLDAIREAQDISPDTLFYILTGFDDFSYAREAPGKRLSFKAHPPHRIRRNLRRSDLPCRAEKSKADTGAEAVYRFFVLRWRPGSVQHNISHSLSPASDHF